MRPLTFVFRVPNSSLGRVKYLLQGVNEVLSYSEGNGNSVDDGAYSLHNDHSIDSAIPIVQKITFNGYTYPFNTAVLTSSATSIDSKTPTPDSSGDNNVTISDVKTAFLSDPSYTVAFVELQGCMAVPRHDYLADVESFAQVESPMEISQYVIYQVEKNPLNVRIKYESMNPE